MQYLDFDVEIDLGKGLTYPIIVRSPAGEIRTTMRFPFDEVTLRDHLKDLQIALLRSGGLRRRILSSQEQTVQNFGQQLFDALLVGDIRSLYDQSRVKAAQNGNGLRLRLHIQAPDLASLPWEYLYDTRHADYICLSRHTPVVRYLDVQQPVQPLTIKPPLRILGMIASPIDQDPLDVQREQERMNAALAILQTEGIIELSWLMGQTWRDLQRALQGGPWHIFHFIGHGGFDTSIQEGVIALVSDQGKTHLLSARELGRLLTNHGSLRLALLNACQGAKGNQLDIFSSTAAVLARRGIPAVLAMQEEITDLAAIEFTRAFYEAVASGLTVDAAVAEARTAISISVPNTLEWGTPVLYLRSADSLLFNLTKKPSKLQSQKQTPLPGPQKTKDEWIEQGTAHLEAREYKEAFEAFEQAIKLAPHDDFIYRQKGEALIGLEQYKEALEAFEQVIKLDPSYALAYARKGDMLRKLKRSEKALPTYERAIQLDSTDTSVYYSKADLLEELGRNQEALRVYDQLIRLDPGDTYAYSEKARLLSWTGGRKEELLNVYNQLLQINPTDIEALGYKAGLLVELGRNQEAAQAYKELILEDSPYSSSWTRDGYISQIKKLGETEALLEVYDQLILRKPQEKSFYEEKIKLLTELQRNQEAVQVYTELILQEPSYTYKRSFYYYRSEIEKLGGDEALLEVYDQLILRNPQERDLYEEKIKVLRKMKRDEEILETLDQFIQQNPYNNGWAWREKMEVFKRLGRTEEAEEAKKRWLGGY